MPEIVGEQFKKGSDYDVWTTLEKGDHPMDVRLVGNVNRILHQHYPGWGWYVECPPNQNVVIVRNLDLDLYGKWGFMMLKDRLIGEGDRDKAIMRAGGELLERWKKDRAGVSPDDINNPIDTIKKPLL